MRRRVAIAQRYPLGFSVMICHKQRQILPLTTCNMYVRVVAWKLFPILQQHSQTKLLQNNYRLTSQRKRSCYIHGSHVTARGRWKYPSGYSDGTEGWTRVVVPGTIASNCYCDDRHRKDTSYQPVLVLSYLHGSLYQEKPWI